VTADVKARSSMLELKERRGGAPQALLDAVREHNAARTAIKKALAAGPETVPAIAQATGLAPGLVLWTVTAMRKYGHVVEDSTDGSYVRYALTTKEAR
jgi:hypothetical protein